MSKVPFDDRKSASAQQQADRPLEITEFVDRPEQRTSPATNSAIHVARESSPLSRSSDSDSTGGAITQAAEAPAARRWSLRKILLAPFRLVAWILRSLFRLVCLILVLAVVAAIPGVNFLALGYLLEAEGRFARTGRWRDAFPMIDAVARVAMVGVGIMLCLFPLWLLAGAAYDARLIDAESSAAAGLRRFLVVASVLITVHICLALARGGRLSCFFRPIKNGRWLSQQIRQGHYWSDADRALREFFAGLRLKYYFSLGIRGFVGGLAWLVLPTALFAAADGTQGGEILVTLLGGLLLIPVLAWLPFLQAHFAVENRMGAIFELRTVRKMYRRAPIAWTLAIVLTLVLSLPLYLAKVVLPPQDAMWMVTVVFIISIYPVKLLTAWAYHRAQIRSANAWFGFRWGGLAVMLPVLSFYVFLLFFTQGIGAHGKAVLFEHHAFLLPVPF